MRFNHFFLWGTLSFLTLACDKGYDFCGNVKTSDKQPIEDVSLIFIGGSQTVSCKTDLKGTCTGSFISGFVSEFEGWLLVFKKGYQRQTMPYTAKHDSACADVVLQPAL